MQNAKFKIQSFLAIQYRGIKQFLKNVSSFCNVKVVLKKSYILVNFEF